jgi:mRNA interferase MazF
MVVHRFEVWLIQLDPTQGVEIKETRPCVILSPDEMIALKTAIVAPMTSKGFEFPTRIPCTFKGTAGLILLDQMRAIDKCRLIQKLGVLPKSTQDRVLECLQELFAM